jgi:hypothetical protein
MKKSLLLFLFGVGLVLVTTGPAFAQVDNLRLGSGTATLAFNGRLGGPAGQMVPNGPVGSAYPAAANNNAHGDATTATFNIGSATLAGTFLLVLLQRRYHRTPS